ncbi:hypothetical protein GLYMA_11G198600v4 [Glycine max]|uniref:Uncharacterized protein n=2 Tax=Glycine subgen. Soja TaxID=1462606 RepID=K7LR60_SOYBN
MNLMIRGPGCDLHFFLVSFQIFFNPCFFKVMEIWFHRCLKFLFNLFRYFFAIHETLKWEADAKSLTCLSTFI